MTRYTGTGWANREIKPLITEAKETGVDVIKKLKTAIDGLGAVGNTRMAAFDILTKTVKSNEELAKLLGTGPLRANVLNTLPDEIKQKVVDLVTNMTQSAEELKHQLVTHNIWHRISGLGREDGKGGIKFKDGEGYGYKPKPPEPKVTIEQEADVNQAVALIKSGIAEGDFKMDPQSPFNTVINGQQLSRYTYHASMGANKKVSVVTLEDLGNPLDVNRLTPSNVYSFTIANIDENGKPQIESDFLFVVSGDDSSLPTEDDDLGPELPYDSEENSEEVHGTDCDCEECASKVKQEGTKLSPQAQNRLLQENYIKRKQNAYLQELYSRYGK